MVLVLSRVIIGSAHEAYNVMVLAPSFNASSMTVGNGLPLRKCVLVGVNKSGGVRIGYELLA